MFARGAALAVGCGGNVVVDSIDTASGTGGAASIDAGPTCDAATFFSYDGGIPSQSYTTSMAEGQLGTGCPGYAGAPDAGGLQFVHVDDPGTFVEGCSPSWPASISDAFIYYGGDTGVALAATLNVTKVEPVGGIIEGTFSGTLYSGPKSNLPWPIAGAFRVCRVRDP
jgi:hypothetical protein